MLDESIGLAEIGLEQGDRRPQLRHARAAWQNSRQGCARCALVRDEKCPPALSQDMSDRLSAILAPAGSANRGTQGAVAGRGGRSGAGASRYPAANRQGARMPVSASLLNSPLVKRSAGRIPRARGRARDGYRPSSGNPRPLVRRICRLPLSNASARKLHGAIVDMAARWQGENEWPDTPFPAPMAAVAGVWAITVAQMDAMLAGNRNMAGLAGGRARRRSDGWRQAHLLHLRAHTLSMELKAAEGALALEDSEENLARLVEIRNEIEKEAAPRR